MKLSAESLIILENFSNINPNIWVESGNVLQTVSPNKTIMGKAVVKDSFPRAFGIYDLKVFLSTLSVHKNEAPTLEFDEHHVLIQGLKGRSQIKYRYAAKEMLVVPPDKTLKLPSTDIIFALDENDLTWVTTTAKVLGSTQIAVRSDGERMYLVTFDVKNDAAHQEVLEIGAAIGVKYNMVFTRDSFNNIITGSYNVQISSQGIAHFKHQTNELEYWLPTETNSTYNKE